MVGQLCKILCWYSSVNLPECDVSMGIGLMRLRFLPCSQCDDADIIPFFLFNFAVRRLSEEDFKSVGDSVRHLSEEDFKTAGDSVSWDT